MRWQKKRVAEAVRPKAEASRGTGLPGFCPAVAPEAALNARCNRERISWTRHRADTRTAGTLDALCMVHCSDHARVNAPVIAGTFPHTRKSADASASALLKL